MILERKGVTCKCFLGGGGDDGGAVSDINKSCLLMVHNVDLTGDWVMGERHVVEEDGVMLSWVKQFELVNVGDEEYGRRVIEEYELALPAQGNKT